MGAGDDMLKILTGLGAWIAAIFWPPVGEWQIENDGGRLYARRLTVGGWSEYREVTAEEETEYCSLTAW